MEDEEDILNNETVCERGQSYGGIYTAKLTLCVLYSLIFIVGIVGNSLVIYVIARFKEMHVVTNIYLLSQAIADFLYLLQIPFLIVYFISSTWFFGYVLCKFYMFSASVIWFAGVFTLTAVSADRYVAVVHFRTQAKYRTKVMAVRAVIALWILSMIIMTPINITSTTYTRNNSTHCMNQWPEWFPQKYFTMYTFWLGYFIPVVLIIIFYSLVIRTLRTSGPDNKNKSKQHKVTTLVLVVVLTYILLWLPYWTNQVYLVYSDSGIPNFRNRSIVTDNETDFQPLQSNWTECPWSSRPQGGNQRVMIISFVSQILSYINSALNPILYAFMSQNFRTCFKSVCRCGGGRRMIFENSTMTTTRTRMTVTATKSLPTYEAMGTFQEVSPVTCDERDKFVILHLTQGNGVDSLDVVHEKAACVQETDID